LATVNSLPWAASQLPPTRSRCNTAKPPRPTQPGHPSMGRPSVSSRPPRTGENRNVQGRSMGAIERVGLRRSFCPICGSGGLPTEKNSRKY